MSKYSSQTVANLKELLKARKLSISGAKKDLIARLTENDNEIQSEPKAQPDPIPPVSEAPEQTNDVPIESNIETPQQSASEEKTLTVKYPEPPVAPIKELTLEEKTARAISDLEKQIERAKKFGDAAGQADAEKSLIRIQKFGIVETDKLVSSGLDSELGNGFHRARGGKFRGRGGRFNNRKGPYKKPTGSAEQKFSSEDEERRRKRAQRFGS